MLYPIYFAGSEVFNNVAMRESPMYSNLDIYRLAELYNINNEAIYLSSNYMLVRVTLTCLRPL